jgi:hypothetical protein
MLILLNKLSLYRSRPGIGDTGVQVSKDAVFGPSPALGRHPGDVLVGIFHVAGLTVDAVGKIELHLTLARLFIDFHLIHIGRTEPEAGILKLPGALIVADIQVRNLQVRGLFLLVGRT